MGTRSCQPTLASAGLLGAPWPEASATHRRSHLEGGRWPPRPSPQLRGLGPCRLLQLPAIGQDVPAAGAPQQLQGRARGSSQARWPPAQLRPARLCLHCSLLSPRARDLIGPERGPGAGGGGAAPKCHPGASDSPSRGVGMGQGHLTHAFPPERRGGPSPSGEVPPPPPAHPYLGWTPRLPQAVS